MSKHCIYCNKAITNRSSKYCSNQCQLDRQYQDYIEKWQRNAVNGSRGKAAKNISAHVKRYLLEKFNSGCAQCGWSQKHPITQKVMLEIHHIDGDAENNQEANLQLLCPNCHSLTITYKNMNHGKGRKWRLAKYIRSS